MKEILSKDSVQGTVTVPGSKSATHRALIAAGLAQGKSILEGPLSCEDTLYTVDGLIDLGVKISRNETLWEVSGTGGNFEKFSGIKSIYLGNAGTSYRFLLSVAGLSGGDIILTGSRRMRERPVGELVKALNELGVDVSCIGQEAFPPAMVKGKGIPGGRVEIRGEKSSQFISSLLLASPYAEKDVDIAIKGELVSRPYVDLTIDMMKNFGVSVIRRGDYGFKVPSGQRYQSSQIIIEGDVSSASYFWAAAAVTGGRVTTKNIHPHSTRQGDIRLLDVMEKMGCHIAKETDRVIVQGTDLRGIEVDMGDMPDMVPTLAAIAVFAEGRTVIRNVSHLRYKESDRLRSIATEWRRLGIEVEELPDGLVIRGGCTPSGTEVHPHNDHRIAMGLALIGLKTPGTIITEPNCVNKSFPGFWDLWDEL